jgi:DNA helicase-4
MIEWLLIGGGTAAVGWYLNYQKVQKEKKEREEILASFNQLWPEIAKLTAEFDKKVSFNSGYFNFSKWGSWKEKSKALQKRVLGIRLEKVALEPAKQSVLQKFQEYTQSPDKFRTDFNKRFIVKELADNKEFFNSIEGKSLDSQQREAVVVDEDHNLVVAGAGSGKTLTIAAKVAYLIERWKVKPEEILLISFTRKSSEEMQERIERKMGLGAKAMTFHKLGIDLIAEVENVKPSIFESSEFGKVISKLLSVAMQDENYLSRLTKYFIEYLKPYKDPEDFESHGEYIQYLKDLNIKSFKKVPVVIDGKQTYLNESCKSYDEVKIANFLFTNNITYKYEAKYEHDTATKEYAQYKPDFYLPDYGIYIEHFAVNRQGEVPKWFLGKGDFSPTATYQAGMKWKKEEHKKHKTTLVETYAYETREGILLEKLRERLANLGVKFSQKSSEEIWNIIQEQSSDDVNAFQQLIQTFISLLKSNNQSVEAIRKKNKSANSGFQFERNSVFIDLAEPIIKGYNDELENRKEIDFNDMINKATGYLSKGQSKAKYKYIIIDEFQDISIGRYSLIKKLLAKNSGCKLFCVGDDWQSIYRFAGSDISIFTEFEKHFGVTSFSKIETTYRFSSELIKTSSEFILKNPKQVPKNLRTTKTVAGRPFEVFYTNVIQGFDPSPFLTALNRIVELEGNILEKSLKVLALSRYSYDIEGFKKDRNFTVTWKEATSSYWIQPRSVPNFEIEFLTVHRAKGLEADYVILLNCNSGKSGFPSEQSDDPFLNLLLSQADQFENGEERRLFYVALTRCRKMIFLLAKSQYTSKFIKELVLQANPSESITCPICKTGAIIEYSGIAANGNPFTRLTCSNWSWGCAYIEWA